MKFEKLGLIGPLLQATVDQGYEHPTPIQEQTFLHVAEGRDVLGCAQTGTGKTAAFSIPVLQQLVLSNQKNAEHGKRHKPSRKGPGRAIRGLILTPTRELAAQIGDSLKNYGRHTKLKHTVIFGGVNQYSQVQALRKGIDILVATPGRLFDLIQQRHVNLSDIEILVLDEADRMLDMGFIVDIRKVMKLIPTERQTLLFSATMPPAIQSLTEEFMRDPVTVKIKAESVAADTVEQSVYFVEHPSKPALLRSLLKNPEMTRVLLFSRTKRGADRICKKLAKSNIHAEAIHSDKSQNARTRAMNNFKSKRTRLLVATDIAARGIDVDHISHVINYDLPDESETYVHRIGRTGRAKNEGKAITFACPDQAYDLKVIEKMLGKPIPILYHDIDSEELQERAVTRLDSIDLRKGGGKKKKGGNSRNRNSWKKNKSPKTSSYKQLEPDSEFKPRPKPAAGHGTTPKKRKFMKVAKGDGAQGEVSEQGGRHDHSRGAHSGGQGGDGSRQFGHSSPAKKKPSKGARKRKVKAGNFSGKAKTLAGKKPSNYSRSTKNH